MKVKVEAFETYPAGVYPVRVKEITLDDDNQYGAQFRFKFELGGALQGKSLTGWCKQSGSIKSKFFEWWKALTGESPQPGEEMDTDLLIGRTAQAVIKVKVKDDGSQKNVIDSLLPTQSQVASPQLKPFENFSAACQFANAELGDGASEALKAWLKQQGLEKFSPSRDSHLVHQFVQEELNDREAEQF